MNSLNALVAVLLAGILLYHRRKVRKPAHRSYCFSAVPPGGDPVNDLIRFNRRKPTD